MTPEQFKQTLAGLTAQLQGRALDAELGRWLNAVDPDDFVSLGRGLDASNFCDGIDNVVDIENDPDDGHAIEGYLADRRIAEAVAAACPP